MPLKSCGTAIGHSIGAFALLALLACEKDRHEQRISGYCGESFCLETVSESDVTKVTPVQDFNRYSLNLSIGRVEVYEGNTPDVGKLRRERVRELPQLDAWELSPTDGAAILIIVGKKWPETLVFSIEGSENSREQLLTLLQGLSIKGRVQNSN
jgi:hypothetical protein